MLRSCKYCSPGSMYPSLKKNGGIVNTATRFFFVSLSFAFHHYRRGYIRGLANLPPKCTYRYGYNEEQGPSFHFLCLEDFLQIFSFDHNSMFSIVYKILFLFLFTLNDYCRINAGYFQDTENDCQCCDGSYSQQNATPI